MNLIQLPPPSERDLPSPADRDTKARAIEILQTDIAPKYPDAIPIHIPDQALIFLLRIYREYHLKPEPIPDRKWGSHIYSTMHKGFKLSDRLSRALSEQRKNPKIRALL